jgi:UDP-N-acetyl-D-galactosamine dehydrogenase
VANTKVLVMGATFKENVTDIRNSKVVDVIKELQSYSVNVEVYDPNADNEEFEHEYQVSLVNNPNNEYDAVVVAVNHDQFTSYSEDAFMKMMKPDGILVDIKGDLRNKIKNLTYWSL